MPDDAAIEAVARAIHADYVGERRGKEPPDHPALRPWEELEPMLRAQNLEQARDNVVKLAEVGLRVVPTAEAGDRRSSLPAPHIERLARAEHDRWARQKQEHGYTYGPTRQDDGSDRRHPNLVPWEQLSEDERDKDRRPVQRIVDMLAAADLAAVPFES